MRRREALGGLLALSAIAMGPLRASAQAQKGYIPFRITTVPDWRPESRGWFSDAMRDLGWTEGRDFIVVQSGILNSGQQLDEAIKRVLVDKPDLILTGTTASAFATHRATATIPIVMTSSGYPVEAGLADSLARPGKNVTGNTIYAGVEVWGKLLQLLRDAQPGIKRVSVLWTYVPPATPREEIEPCYAELRNAERLLGLQLHIVEAANVDRVSAALGEIEVERPDALLLAGGVTVQVVSSIVQFAIKRRLASITDFAWPAALVDPYPLLSYGPVFRELVRSAVAFVDKVMRGAKPRDLPIQQPAKFEMVLNLKTAKMIDLIVPTDLLLRADKVIE
jgi:putative ABC transport system substrate-binding protein